MSCPRELVGALDLRADLLPKVGSQTAGAWRVSSDKGLGLIHEKRSPPSAVLEGECVEVRQGFKVHGFPSRNFLLDGEEIDMLRVVRLGHPKPVETSHQLELVLLPLHGSISSPLNHAQKVRQVHRGFLPQNLPVDPVRSRTVEGFVLLPQKLEVEFAMMANAVISIMGDFLAKDSQDAVCVRSRQTEAFDGRWVEVAQHSVSSLKEGAVPDNLLAISRFHAYGMDSLLQESGC